MNSNQRNPINIERIKYLIRRIILSLQNDKFSLTFSKFKHFLFSDTKIDLDNLKLDPKLTLDEICLTFGTDKSFLDGKKRYEFLRNSGDRTFKNYFEWVKRKNLYDYEYPLGNNYTPFYEKYFEKKRFDKLKILEIGVANGHSTASFYYYFPNSELYGIDIKDKYKVFYKGKRIIYNKIDITNQKKVLEYLKKHNNFDIIVDDSLHSYYGFTNNIKNFFPAVKSGGIYILEDFNGIDDYIIKIRKWNSEHNKKPWMYLENTMDDVFQNIKEKKFFEDYHLDKDTQKYLMDNIKDIKSERSHHPSGSIAFLLKK